MPNPRSLWFTYRFSSLRCCRSPWVANLNDGPGFRALPESHRCKSLPAVLNHEPTQASQKTARIGHPMAATGSESIQTRLALRPGLPSPMHPQPLVGIAAHVIFNHFRELRRVGDNVGFIVSSANKL